ncbi:MAG: orotidine-5'-phosphate decarboxylase [Saprospiraceae bacterium]|nr:orotidine-5'-phosphate decarboxylase [Saprospiraceae bacterium]
MTRQHLIAEIFRKRSFLCVGLDPEPERIPAHLHHFPDPVLEFNKRIIDATRDLCVAYKPNTAFYEALGPRGWVTLAETAAYIGEGHFRIADAKRGDIGNTSRKYAQAFFEQMPFDAVTVAPYMGEDSVTPFLDFPGKWVILLALTSNTGSADFQFTQQSDTREKFFEKVLLRAGRWGSPANLMFVVGATHPDAFRQVRSIVPDHFLLVPGVGAQGGELADVCRYGLTPDCGLLVNSSRGILYASDGEDFAEKARAAALTLQQQMDKLLP